MFRMQSQENPVYLQYVNSVQRGWDSVLKPSQIPFLPISFFKSHAVKTGIFEPELVFESSGTTQTVNSRHQLKKAAVYRQSFLLAFEKFYGPVKDWCILGLLPAYLERQNSSLVVMVDELVKLSNHPQSGFYLYDHERLHENLLALEGRGQKTLLIGVSFALLDFAEKYKLQLKHTVVMETGGMKGRRRELTRPELHQYLCERLGVASVHSEYGMTELLSQAYSSQNGIFRCPPWMKILLREEDDPFAIVTPDDVKEGMPVNGVINVIDLANIYSCSFIATDDMGKLYADGSFEVLGRLDNSDIRGCSLMAV